jgi:hypothetical protein
MPKKYFRAQNARKNFFNITFSMLILKSFTTICQQDSQNLLATAVGQGYYLKKRQDCGQVACRIRRGLV